MSNLEFDFSVHSRESNPESQAILDNNRHVFGKQCSVIFNALMSGRTLDSATSVKEFGIVDFRRRLADLRAAGVQMNWIPAENGRSKVWRMSKELIEFNKSITS